MKKILFLFFITLLVLLPSISAIQVGYTAVKPHVFQGEELQYIIRILNDEGSEKTVTIRSIDLNWLLKGDRLYATIKPYEEKEILITYEPIGKGLQQGRYKVSLIVETSISKVEKFLPAEVIADDKIFSITVKDYSILNPDKNNILSLNIKNNYLKDFEDLSIEITSSFFSFKDSFSVMGQKTTIIEEEVTIPRSVVEGKHPLHIKIREGKKILFDKDIPVTVRGLEDLRSVEKSMSGFLKSGKKITKTNTGNTVETLRLEVRKSFFSHLFTSYEPEPTAIFPASQGKKIVWDYTIHPGEEQEFIYTTSYRLPFFILLLILLALSAYFFFRRNNIIDIEKRALTVMSTQGEIKTLKVLIHIKNRSTFTVKKILVQDKIPSVLGSPESYGTSKPLSIKKNEEGIRLLWALENLRGKSERTISYSVEIKKAPSSLNLGTALAKYRLRGRKVIARSNMVSVQTKK